MNLDRNTKFSSNLNFLSSMFSPHSNYIICYKEKAGIPQSRKALRAPAPSCYVTLLSVAQQAVPRHSEVTNMNQITFTLIILLLLIHEINKR